VQLIVQLTKPILVKSIRLCYNLATHDSHLIPTKHTRFKCCTVIDTTCITNPSTCSGTVWWH